MVNSKELKSKSFERIYFLPFNLEKTWLNCGIITKITLTLLVKFFSLLPQKSYPVFGGDQILRRSFLSSHLIEGGRRGAIQVLLFKRNRIRKRYIVVLTGSIQRFFKNLVRQVSEVISIDNQDSTTLLQISGNFTKL